MEVVPEKGVIYCKILGFGANPQCLREQFPKTAFSKNIDVLLELSQQGYFPLPQMVPFRND